jgi:hypothetical protein
MTPITARALAGKMVAPGTVDLYNALYVPEPTTANMLIVAAAVIVMRWRRGTRCMA